MSFSIAGRICLRAFLWRHAGTELEFCAFAGEPERDEGGSDFRRRIERVARNFEDKFRTRVELGNDGKIAVVASAGLGSEAVRHFSLNDDVNFVDEVGEIEEAVKNRRGDVVGKVAIDADAAAGSDRGDVRFENVAGNDGEIGELFGKAAKSRDERRINFDGVDGSASGEKVLGDFTMAGSNFDPTMLIVLWKRGLQTLTVPTSRDTQRTFVAKEWRQGMRRDANGAGDLFAPVEIGEEVLAETLACHGWNSVARGARFAARGKEVKR